MLLERMGTKAPEKENGKGKREIGDNFKRGTKPVKTETQLKLLFYHVIIFELAEINVNFLIEFMWSRKTNYFNGKKEIFKRNF